MPVVATCEVASNVVAPVAVTPETIAEAAPAISKPDITIVASLDTGVIPSPPVIMPGMTTLPHSPTIGLVSYHKSNPHYFLFCFFLLLPLCNKLCFMCQFTAAPFCLRSIALI